MTEIQNRLFALRDLKYKEFQSRLMPTVEPNTVIGVRTPQLRRLAKELAKEGCGGFLNELPHKYYEENNLHAFIIEQNRDFREALSAVTLFLPFVDNWATCDSMCPKVFKEHTGELLEKIKEWISSERTYTVRYGLGMLMRFYLDGNFKEEYLSLAAGVRSEEYYVNMMIAWYFATALAKQYEQTLPYIKERRLGAWTHNKAIQKAVESYRITDEQKEYLKTLKIKKGL